MDMDWCEGSGEGSIIKGCARTLWALAWADHVDETTCCNLSGCNIMDYMPEVGSMALYEAGQIIGAFEQASGYNIIALTYAALRADDIDPEKAFGGYAERFGECLAYSALGHGVSWADDHAECPLLEKAIEVIHRESDLGEEVAKACENHS